ncbi:hypothetical protein DFJ73DRAFT_770492 [Zopfochytrium polystomum]|nr:hypothetical protein DFJ73DRAFT_770492 [Zopfochytrium polystomum]
MAGPSRPWEEPLPSAASAELRSEDVKDEVQHSFVSLLHDHAVPRLPFSANGGAEGSEQDTEPAYALAGDWNEHEQATRELRSGRDRENRRIESWASPSRSEYWVDAPEGAGRQWLSPVRVPAPQCDDDAAVVSATDGRAKVDTLGGPPPPPPRPSSPPPHEPDTISSADDDVATAAATTAAATAGGSHSSFPTRSELLRERNRQSCRRRRERRRDERLSLTAERARLERENAAMRQTLADAERESEQAIARELGYLRSDEEEEADEEEHEQQIPSAEDVTAAAEG